MVYKRLEADYESKMEWNNGRCASDGQCGLEWKADFKESNLNQ